MGLAGKTASIKELESMWKSKRNNHKRSKVKSYLCYSVERWSHKNGDNERENRWTEGEQGL